MDERRVLVSTIAPISGGVPTMARFITGTLQTGGLTPVLAHYEPHSVTPELSVPSYRVWQGRPGKSVRTTWGHLETHAIGAWLPELEFTHYRPNGLWRELMESCSRFVAVCGNVLAALPFAKTNRPFAAWVATAWEEDRRDRVREFPTARRWLDQSINAPVLRRLECDILRSGQILPLSEHTQKSLDSIAGDAVCRDILPMPIDSDFFSPNPPEVTKGRVGFTGRFDDPRKNIDLLTEAVALSESVVTMVLVGGSMSPELERQINQLGLEGRVDCIDYVPRNRLRDLLQTLDVFVLPSHQEGLCISALEAMACGCPVVSTRCGGPEEFVRDDETGYLVDFDAAEMAAAIQRIIADRQLRARLSNGARQLVVDHYNRQRCENIFWGAFKQQEISPMEKAV